MTKFVLFALFILGRLTAADTSALSTDLGGVDKQIAVWESIHATKRQISNFSYTETHFPEVLERIAYMAKYVKKTIAGIKARETRVDDIIGYADSLCKEGKLTFQAATELFDSLAIVSDVSISLSKPKQSRWRFREAEAERNLAFLCVPKGSLTIARFADACLSEFPLRYIVLPNRPLKDGPHGSDHSIYEFFDHDRGHASQGDVAIWKQLWPGLKKIGDYRITLSLDSFERRSIDVFLFRFFHEANFSYNDPYPPCQTTSSGYSITKDLETFSPFIERLGSMSKLYPFIPGNSYLVLSGVADLVELLIKKNITSGSDQFLEFAVQRTDKGFALSVSGECPLSLLCTATFNVDIVTATKDRKSVV